ncbi:hypothetical protein ACH5TX_03960, partial [Flavobacteriaceae bacterium MEBiC06459]
MSYQAIVRNSSDVILSNQNISIQISILQGNSTGVAVYTETQSLTTNINGLANIEIGTGTAINGDFSTIDWSNNTYFIKTEIDTDGGTNYTITGTSQLMSVPYALYAANSGSSTPGPAGANGKDGDSAYQIWLDNENTGTEAEFLASLVGETGAQGPQGIPGNDGADGADGVNGTNGVDGADGDSAYQIWLDNENTGTEAEFLASLVGETGAQGPQGVAGNDGADGADGADGVNGTNGVDGADGDSAYQIWLDNENTGTEAEFLASLVGETGAQGPQGVVGNDGADGVDGADGDSAYQIWLDNENTGTKADFLASLVGETGAQGPQGVPGNDGADGSDATVTITNNLTSTSTT